MSEPSHSAEDLNTKSQETIDDPKGQVPSPFDKINLPNEVNPTHEYSKDLNMSGTQVNVTDSVSEEVTEVIAPPHTSCQPSTSKDSSPNTLKILLHGSGSSKVTPAPAPAPLSIKEEDVLQNPASSMYHITRRHPRNLNGNDESKQAVTLIEFLREYNRHAVYNIEYNNNQLNKDNVLINPTRNSCPVSDCTRRTGSSDSSEPVCRICHENANVMTFITPCICKGSMGPIHQDCLERWLSQSGKTACEICGYEYTTERRAKYSGCSSFWNWIRNPSNPNDAKNLLFDIACFFILTPLASISAWLCVVGSQHYAVTSQERFKESYNSKNQRYRHIQDASNSTWTSIGLLTLTATLLTAYYVWLFVAFRYHYQVWREWQNRNFIVKVLPITPPEEDYVEANVIQRERNGGETTILMEPGVTGIDKRKNESSSSSSASASTSKSQSLPALSISNSSSQNNNANETIEVVVKTSPSNPGHPIGGV